MDFNRGRISETEGHWGELSPLPLGRRVVSDIIVESISQLTVGDIKIDPSYHFMTSANLEVTAKIRVPCDLPTDDIFAKAKGFGVSNTSSRRNSGFGLLSRFLSFGSGKGSAVISIQRFASEVPATSSVETRLVRFVLPLVNGFDERAYQGAYSHQITIETGPRISPWRSWSGKNSKPIHINLAINHQGGTITLTDSNTACALLLSRSETPLPVIPREELSDNEKPIKGTR